jgi:hypothetical protein
VIGTPLPGRPGMGNRASPGKLPTPLVHHKEYSDSGMTPNGRRSYL